MARPNLAHDYGRGGITAGQVGQDHGVRRHHSPAASGFGDHGATPGFAPDDGVSGDAVHRRPTRASALLMGLALLCATLTVVFGFWLADLVPSY